MPNNIGINNVSSMNFSKKNSYGISYTSYIIIPIVVLIIILSLLFGLKLLITGEIVPSIQT